MSDQRVADADARERALDPTQSFIVQAPAGSGKTELLTQRTLALLALAEEPEEVVAITFTRKAAAEMRARVFGAIRRAAGPAPEDAHAHTTWSLAGRVLARSRACGWSLEQSPQRLRVTTIDALAASIAQQSPLLSELGGGVVVEDDPQELYRQAARDTLALLEDPRHGATIARGLSHYDNRVQAFEAELADLLPRRDQWIELAVREAPEHRREAMEAVLRNCAQGALRELESILPKAVAVEWHMLACYAADNLTREKPDHPLTRCLDVGTPAYDAETLERWQILLQLVFTEKDWRKAFNKNLGFPTGEGPIDKRTAKAFKDRATSLVDLLRQIPGCQSLLMRIRSLPPIHYTDAQWEILVALLDTLKLAAGQLKVLFAEGGTVDFVEIGQRAVQAMGREDAPTDLALRLDYRVRHLLVDEFQDTSRLQLDLLGALTAGWQDGDDRTLFVVGDPAQSIYRFREAEVGYFLGARRDGLCGIRLTPLELTCNFRSSSRLVDWFNETFPAVLAPQEDVVHGAVAYASAIATRDAKVTDRVQVHATIDCDWNAEAQAVVETIKELRRTEPQASVAILVRSRNHLTALAPALRRHGLRYQAVEIEELATRPVIEDLRALTRALLHPMDRVAWFALLRARWCGLSLQDLHALAQGWKSGEPLAPMLRDPVRIATLSSDGRDRLCATLEILEVAQARLGRVRLRDLVEQAWLALGGPACCARAVDLSDAARFFAVLDKIQRGGDLPSLAALDRALAALRAAPDPDGGLLQVMTIHKSKGLEFDHVLLPGLHRSPQRGGRAPLAWTTLPGVDGPQFLIAPIGASGRTAGCCMSHAPARVDACISSATARTMVPRPSHRRTAACCTSSGNVSRPSLHRPTRRAGRPRTNSTSWLRVGHRRCVASPRAGDQRRSRRVRS
jgi:ATP-dependent helicase/nuclease subunit A